jgi:hypothetical protein
MSERTHAELLISKAYAKLSAIPKDGSQASVSLASIGSYEVRMFLRRGADLNGVPQFGWSYSITAQEDPSTASYPIRSMMLRLYLKNSCRTQHI